MYDLKKFNEATAKLVANHQTLAVAESVTAGLVQHAFSTALNAASFFEGGITAYNYSQKCTHLFIEPVHAIECNCVSQKVAEEMALGVSRSFKSDWGIGITGYASPVPELNVEQLYACIAISFAGKIINRKIIFAEKESAENVQVFFRDALIDLVTEYWRLLPELAGQE